MSRIIVLTRCYERDPRFRAAWLGEWIVSGRSPQSAQQRRDHAAVEALCAERQRHFAAIAASHVVSDVWDVVPECALYKAPVISTAASGDTRKRHREAKGALHAPSSPSLRSFLRWVASLRRKR